MTAAYLSCKLTKGAFDSNELIRTRSEALHFRHYFLRIYNFDFENVIHLDNFAVKFAGVIFKSLSIVVKIELVSITLTTERIKRSIHFIHVADRLLITLIC